MVGNYDNGSVDLIWINGENFVVMKKYNLFVKDWVKEFDYFVLICLEKNFVMVIDFGEFMFGMEVLWGKVFMVFYYCSVYMKVLGIMFG